MSSGEPSRLFFFSSRRRHTRSLCDWSSDVCSSDLRPKIETPGDAETACLPNTSQTEFNDFMSGTSKFMPNDDFAGMASYAKSRLKCSSGIAFAMRSEERRVGEECRSRRTTYA